MAPRPVVTGREPLLQLRWGRLMPLWDHVMELRLLALGSA